MAQLDGFSVFFEGRQATEDDVKVGSHTLVLADSREPELHAFGSQSALFDWANLRQDWKRVAHVLGVEQLARHAEGADLRHAIKLHTTRYERLRQDLDELSQETGLQGSELLRYATVGAPMLDGPASHSAFLHEHAWGGGGFVWMPSGIPIPSFDMYNMQDRASVLYFAAAWGGAIYEHTWFQGRTFWFWGVSPSAGFALRPLGFDNIASSGWSS